jgi:hypothetical protein
LKERISSTEVSVPCQSIFIHYTTCEKHNEDARVFFFEISNRLL